MTEAKGRGRSKNFVWSKLQRCLVVYLSFSQDPCFFFSFKYLTKKTKSLAFAISASRKSQGENHDQVRIWDCGRRVCVCLKKIQVASSWRWAPHSPVLPCWPIRLECEFQPGVELESWKRWGDTEWDRHYSSSMWVTPVHFVYGLACSCFPISLGGNPVEGPFVSCDNHPGLTVPQSSQHPCCVPLKADRKLVLFFCCLSRRLEDSLPVQLS